MKSDPDKILNQLVVAALTVFVVVIILLAALILRHLWLQQQIADLHNEVQVSLEDLGEITEEIQRELVEIQATPGQARSPDTWEEITDALDDVDEQLDSLEGDLSEVALALEPQENLTATIIAADEPADAAQDQVDQVFTIFAVLVGIAAIAIAILLSMAVRVQQNTSYIKSHRL